MSILLRIQRRRTSCEESDANEVLKAEFRRKDGTFDLWPSVYEIEDEQRFVVRAHTEHYANANLNPRRMVNIDVSGLSQSEPIATADSIRFRFIRDAHRELHFEDRPRLLSFVRKLLAGVDSRKRSVEEGEMRSYVADRLSNDDSEWLDFTHESLRGAKWRRWALKDT